MFIVCWTDIIKLCKYLYSIIQLHTYQAEGADTCRSQNKGFTHLSLKLSEMLPIRNMVSMIFRTKRQRLKEFFILGRSRMYPAMIFRKIPIMARMVLVTPSSQYAVFLIQNCSVSVWFGQISISCSVRLCLASSSSDTFLYLTSSTGILIWVVFQSTDMFVAEFMIRGVRVSKAWIQVSEALRVN